LLRFFPFIFILSHGLGGGHGVRGPLTCGPAIARPGSRTWSPTSSSTAPSRAACQACCTRRQAAQFLLLLVPFSEKVVHALLLRLGPGRSLLGPDGWVRRLQARGLGRLCAHAAKVREAGRAAGKMWCGPSQSSRVLPEPAGLRKLPRPPHRIPPAPQPNRKKWIFISPWSCGVLETLE
jgi:hypothetical protein